jgi:peptide/nickel transport system substrate-binding protein
LLVVPAQAATRVGTLVFGRAIESQFLDPVNTSHNADIWLSLNLYDPLLMATADGKGVEPGLASAWTVSPDGMTVTFTMRPGIKFADGSPIELSDVKWSLDRARSKETGGDFSFLLWSIKSIDTAAPDKVILHMQHPDPVILQALATFNSGIMPEKLLMAAPGATWMKEQGVRRASRGVRPVHADELAAQQRNGAEPQSVLLEARR